MSLFGCELFVCVSVLCISVFCVFQCLCAGVHLREYVHVRPCERCVCVCVCACVCVHMCVCMCVCMCVYMCVFVLCVCVHCLCVVFVYMWYKHIVQEMDFVYACIYS